MTAPTQSVPPTRHPTRTPLRVVVVDDHPLYRQGVVRALEAAGENVVGEGADGAAALALIRHHRPDVALVDVRMPGIDGIDVADALAHDGPDVPVVLLSAFDDAALIRQGLEAGAAAFISKDSDRDEILRAMRAAAAATRRPAERDRQGVLLERLNDDERWLLRLAEAGMLDRSDMARQTGFSQAQVVAELTKAIDKLGASNLPEALQIARRSGLATVSLDRRHRRSIG